MDKRATESLAQFCIQQRHAFEAQAWHQRIDHEGQAVALAAKYLSMTSWYGHETELEQIAANTRVSHETSHGLHRESQAIGFDLPYFSALVRVGIMREKQGQAQRRALADGSAVQRRSSLRIEGFYVGSLA